MEQESMKCTEVSSNATRIENNLTPVGRKCIKGEPGEN
jgi:hypothetical protein